MRLLYFTALFFTFNTLLGQTEPTEFGDVTPAEFKTTEFPDASSVILFEKRRFVYDDRDYVYPLIERHLRVLVRNKEGIAYWGDYSLGSANVKYTKVRAATYSLEHGRVVVTELDKDAVIVDRKNSFEKIFSLPKLTEGCIIELSWTVTYFRNISPSRIIQYDVPVLWSEYLLGKTKPLTILTSGGMEPAIYDKNYKSAYTRWVFKNIPAFIEEPYMTAWRNHVVRLEFFLAHENWTNVSKTFQERHFLLYEKFQKRVLKRAADEATAGITDERDRLKAIVTYVKKNFTWDGIEDFLAYDLTEVYNKKKGSVGDLNILLNTMLQEAGFKSTLVLLSTRSNGWIYKEIPTDTQFNYILSKVRIGDKDYFLDATDPLLAFDALPMECVNTEGFELVENTFNWIKIFPALRDKINVNARLTLLKDLSLKGRVTVMSHGFEARKKRKSYKTLGEDDFIKKNDDLSTWTIDSARITNQEKLEQPFQEVYFATIPDRVTETPGQLYIEPFVLLTDKENIWKSEIRNYPIDLLVPTDKLLVVTLTIPADWKVEELPPNQTFTMPDNSISCSFKATQSDNVIVTTYQFTTRRTLFSKEEYPSIRLFYSQLLGRQHQPIVLKKV
jgi:hypothetical protein